MAKATMAGRARHRRFRRIGSVGKDISAIIHHSEWSEGGNGKRVHPLGPGGAALRAVVETETVVVIEPEPFGVTELGETEQEAALMASVQAKETVWSNPPIGVSSTE
jgi:hypothetical protein